MCVCVCVCGTKELIRGWGDQKCVGSRNSYIGVKRGGGNKELIHVCEEGVTKEFPSKYSHKT